MAFQRVKGFYLVRRGVYISLFRLTINSIRLLWVRFTGKPINNTRHISSPGAYVERRWWDEQPDKYYDYNPSGLDFNYDDYDYSNTVSVKGDIDYDYNDWKNFHLLEYDAAVKIGWIDKANPYETFSPGNTPAEEIKRRQRAGYLLYTPIIRADGSAGVNLFEKRWLGAKNIR